MQYELGFIGAGNMAEAIARAAVDHGVLDASQIIAFDPAENRRDAFASIGIQIATDNAAVITQSKQILIAVKPQMMQDAAADLAAHVTDDQVIVSIMAGITSSRLSDAVGKPLRVVRVMPNTPMLVGAGMAGIALGESAQNGDQDLAMKLFGAGGKAVTVDEPMIDTITAVSGSGPAYLFYLAEAMEEAARQLGLGEHAELLVSQTVLGAAKLLNESPDSAAELRRKVTSPKGTTEAAIKHLDGNKSTDVIINAIKAAHARSIELGKN